jgi:UDP-N-acetylmuramate--alanine ligase
MELNQLHKIYFIGIGGIGMSALARYFIGLGLEVHGYDRTETELTRALASEGMIIHYTDDVAYIPKAVDLVIYTPAVPKEHTELIYFQNNNIPVLKRSEVLGLISRGMKCIGVAGTHGKTTTSCLVTHILRVGGVDATAFLGGISLSIGSNFVQGKSDWVVVEADEYDRSFLRLSPDMAIINSMDPDHLDIYGDEKTFRQAFRDYTQKVKPGGQVFKKQGLILRGRNNQSVAWSTYGVKKGDYRSVNLRVEHGFFVFDYKSPKGDILNIKTTLPGQHNIENATAAIAVAQQLGVTGEKVKEALANFKGIKRRFQFIHQNENKALTFIDDYAHHPTELNAAIQAARTLYPKRRLIGIFQPHLFSRTNDFQEGFAAALDKLDETFLLDIYPARELPMPGVTSQILFDKMVNPNKTLLTKPELMSILRGRFSSINLENTTILTLGAGDIDTFVAPISALLNELS